jgi:hypothetical protein
MHGKLLFIFPFPLRRKAASNGITAAPINASRHSLNTISDNGDPRRRRNKSYLLLAFSRRV